MKYSTEDYCDLLRKLKTEFPVAKTEYQQLEQERASEMLDYLSRLIVRLEDGLPVLSDLVKRRAPAVGLRRRADTKLNKISEFFSISGGSK